MKRAERKSGRGRSDSRRTGGKRRKENAVFRYFRQTWAELKKVSWPTRREAANLTLMVLVVTAAMSAFLGVIDWLFSLFFSWLIQLSS